MMAGASNILTMGSMIQGTGVFLEEPIAAGEVLLKIEGVVTASRSPASFQIGLFQHLETSAIARFVNHSCEPRCYLRLSTGSSLELVTLMALTTGDEITLDYAMFENERPNGPIPCRCGSDSCRGFVLGYNELNRHQRVAIAPFVLPYLLRAP
jgi:hypothetical protein